MLAHLRRIFDFDHQYVVDTMSKDIATGLLFERQVKHQCVCRCVALAVESGKNRRASVLAQHAGQRCSKNTAGRQTRGRCEVVADMGNAQIMHARGQQDAVRLY